MEQIDGKSILKTINELCKIGPRWMGTDGAEKARDFVFAALESLGKTTESMPFRYMSYGPGHASLIVDGEEIACEPVALAPSTKKPLAGEIVFAGQCEPKTLRSISESGKKMNETIVLSDNLRTFVAYPHVQASGAAGFLSMTTLDDNTIRCGCASLDRKPGSIPGGAIGGADGRKLLERLGGGTEVFATLDVGGQIEEKVGHNVTACPSTPEVLFTAHYDSFWNGVHAMDNAAGVASVVEIIRCTSSSSSSDSIGAVVFGAEELGCWGSSAFVAQRREILKNLKAVINLDTFGSNRSGLEVGVTADLLATCQSAAEEEGVQIDCWNTPPRAASDQHDFVQAGIPAIWIANCGTDPRYHTPLDVPEEMDSDKLQTTARLALAFAGRILRSPVLSGD